MNFIKYSSQEARWAINVNNINSWKSQQTRCSHRRYVDFVIHSSLSTIYQLLFAGYQREPAWASRTVDEESAQPRPNLWNSGKRRNEVKVSAYETPITDLGSKLISLSILCQPSHSTSHDGRCTTYVDIGWADHIANTHPGQCQCQWPGTCVRSLDCTEIITNVPFASTTTIPSR